MEPQPRNEALGHYWDGDVKNVTDAEFEALYGGKLDLYDPQGVFGANDACLSWSSSRSAVARFVVNHPTKQRIKQWNAQVRLI